MKHCRARALVLLEAAERTANPEYKAKVAALAETWLTLAAIDDALTIWADELKGKGDGPGLDSYIFVRLPPSG
jgi:hypothetical protein